MTQLGQIIGEVRGDLDVLVGRVGDQFGETCVCKDADAAAGDWGLAAECDDGDAHPEGVAGCGAAYVGEGVEGDVDLAIFAEVVLKREAVDEDDSVGGDPALGELIAKTIAVAALGGVQDQSGIGNAG